MSEDIMSEDILVEGYFVRDILSEDILTQDILSCYDLLGTEKQNHVRTIRVDWIPEWRTLREYHSTDYILIGGDEKDYGRLVGSNLIRLDLMRRRNVPRLHGEVEVGADLKSELNENLRQHREETGKADQGT